MLPPTRATKYFTEKEKKGLMRNIERMQKAKMGSNLSAATGETLSTPRREHTPLFLMFPSEQI